MLYDTLKAAINAFNTASDDATRYHINHVLMTASGDNVCLVATNGHILSEVTVNDPGLAASVGKDKFVINAGLLSPLKELAKQFKGTEISHSRDGAVITLKGAGLDVRIETEDACHVTFPDYKAVFPKCDKEPTTISFNAKYLAAIVKALAEDSRDLCVTLSINGPLDAIRVTMRDGRVGLVMPMKK